jgi:hypothetical protein
MALGRRGVIEATLIAATLSGVPSTLHALIKGRTLRSAAVYVHDATSAAGTLLPPGRPGVVRGAVVHVAISMLCGEALARTLPRDHRTEWGAAAGLMIGVLNVGLIGRLFPAIRSLPLVPQIADNVMFGTLFALTLDRRERRRGNPLRLTGAESSPRDRYSTTTG